MNGETKRGLGVLGAMALCCGGPLLLSALASGAVMGALGVVWDGSRLLLLLGGGAVVIVAAVWLLARRLTSPAHADAACCAAPMPSPGVGGGDDAAVHAASFGNETA